jgi:hypothetical protein
MRVNGTDGGPMTVWCPLVPPEDLLGMGLYKKNLSEVSSAYYDWCASMRSKSLDTVPLGALLDRIRMLMISVGIACGQNRDLAESVQKIVAENLRKGASRLVSKLPAESEIEQTVKKTLAMFFARLKFTRDIDPKEEIRKSMPESVSVKPEGDEAESVGVFSKIQPQGMSRELDIDDKIEITKLAVNEGTEVAKVLFTRLLSPDPYGNNS